MRAGGVGAKGRGFFWGIFFLGNCEKFRAGANFAANFRLLEFCKNYGNQYFCNLAKNNGNMRLLVLIAFYRMSTLPKFDNLKIFGKHVLSLFYKKGN